MGFLDKLRQKKDKVVDEVRDQTTPQPTNAADAQPGRRIKKYTSEGKPVYE
jgi:hypothetical protein